MKCVIVFILMCNVVSDSQEYNRLTDTGPYEGFVVGGVPIPIMMYPHVAQLKLGSQVCGGSIISNRVIVTAAHCLFSSNGTAVSAENSLYPSGPSQKWKATRMHYINSEKCEQTPLPGEMPVPDHMFCLLGEGWTSDCLGDSGSGIIWRRLLVGVVSIGRDVFCGSDLLPSMYTDLVHFREWIKEKVTKLESLSANKCENSKRKKS